MGLSANHPAGYTSSSNKSSPARSASVQHRRTRPTDLASFDSSDTWASCNPFPSITDLAGWSPQSGGPADQLLYVKPLPEEQQMQANYVTTDETSRLLFQHINEVTQPDDASVRKVPCRHHRSQILPSWLHFHAVDLCFGCLFVNEQQQLINVHVWGGWNRRISLDRGLKKRPVPKRSWWRPSRRRRRPTRAEVEWQWWVEVRSIKSFASPVVAAAEANLHF